MDITAQDKQTSEKEQFWKDHAKLQRESGLSRVAYCRKHQLSYDQFGYWKHKWRQQAAPFKLLPVNFSRPDRASERPQLETICTLAFKNGHELKIHDSTVLLTLLSLWS